MIVTFKNPAHRRIILDTVEAILSNNTGIRVCMDADDFSHKSTELYCAEEVANVALEKATNDMKAGKVLIDLDEYIEYAKQKLSAAEIRKEESDND